MTGDSEIRRLAFELIERVRPYTKSAPRETFRLEVWGDVGFSFGHHHERDEDFENRQRHILTEVVMRRPLNHRLSKRYP